MSEFNGFRDSYYDQSTGASSSANPSASPHTSMNIPTINVKREDVEQFLSQSSDIKKQLSASLGGAGGSYGGVNKPTSRKGSIITIRSQEDDDDADQGNERKRRDNINEKIQELLTLIPAKYFDPKLQKDAKKEEDVKNSGTKDGKPNKGQILTKSVDYLRDLQNLIDENNRKEVELQMRLRQLEGNTQQQGPSYTSAERALGEIGVGPLSEEYFKGVLADVLRRKP
ncbi:hypothetical protein DIURU_004140 [Diutina rugosa]|uniref:BHLH domain-containing protein n=1 Tax=Diutina rugosa TaxID=5481 RepID=A0A642UIY3_DIURU|nr:uncharacterized protein DIURU_004140 [Diutina rugosa]KAA8899883.1 hypothetical protein DIURU_004140 [Diutina rugosa]